MESVSRPKKRVKKSFAELMSNSPKIADTRRKKYSVLPALNRSKNASEIRVVPIPVAKKNTPKNRERKSNFNHGVKRGFVLAGLTIVT